MVLHYDNKATIAIVKNSVQHDRTKHIKVHRHFIKDHLNQETINLSFVSSQAQLADILTKIVSEKIFYSSLNKL